MVMARWGFREELAFSIGYAVSRSRGLLRRIIEEHVMDVARHQLAERILRHLEQSGFEVDEDAEVLRWRPPVRPHG